MREDRDRGIVRRFGNTAGDGGLGHHCHALDRLEHLPGVEPRQPQRQAGHVPRDRLTDVPGPEQV